MTGGAERLTVAVAGVEFGWGSAGKLDAVVRELRALRGPASLRIIGLGSKLGRPLLDGCGIDRWYDIEGADSDGTVASIVLSQGVSAGLCVLDAAMARKLEAAKVPTTFVDSLPFLWTEGDREWLPTGVAAYCAQRCPELPPESSALLSSVDNLHWVEAVVPPLSAPPRAGRDEPSTLRRAIVSLGGLRAPMLDDWQAYPRLVVPPLLQVLADRGVTSVLVCGNLPDAYADELIATAPTPLDLTVARLTHDDFLTALTGHDLLVTSPGLTTLLEASTLGVPTVCLPPQNISQIFNARFHEQATGPGHRVGWPEGVLSEQHALDARALGEDAALRVVYDSIAAAARDPEPVRAALRRSVADAVRRAGESDTDWHALTSLVGAAGAGQVAGHLLRLAAARNPAVSPTVNAR